MPTLEKELERDPQRCLSPVLQVLFVLKKACMHGWCAWISQSLMHVRLAGSLILYARMYCSCEICHFPIQYAGERWIK